MFRRRRNKYPEGSPGFWLEHAQRKLNALPFEQTRAPFSLLVAVPFVAIAAMAFFPTLHLEILALALPLPGLAFLDRRGRGYWPWFDLLAIVGQTRRDYERFVAQPDGPGHTEHDPRRAELNMLADRARKTALEEARWEPAEWEATAREFPQPTVRINHLATIAMTSALVDYLEGRDWLSKVTRSVVQLGPVRLDLRVRLGQAFVRVAHTIVGFSVGVAIWLIVVGGTAVAPAICEPSIIHPQLPIWCVDPQRYVVEAVALATPVIVVFIGYIAWAWRASATAGGSGGTC